MCLCAGDDLIACGHWIEIAIQGDLYMRSKKGKEWEREQMRGANRAFRSSARSMSPKFLLFSRIWSVVYIVLLALFIFMLFSADILPLILLIPIVLIMLLISLFIFPELFFYNIKKNRKIIAVVVASLLIPVLAYGSIGLGSVAGFFNAITSGEGQTMTFYVVTKKDGPLKKIDDIKGHVVGTYGGDEPIYIAAKKKLAKKFQVDYQTNDNIEEMANSTLSGAFESTLMSQPHYETLTEKVDGFKKGTKILYKFKIKLAEADLAKHVNVRKEPFNIYISGLDVSGKIDVTSRSDVNMILTVNPKTNKIVLTSIPRDSVISMRDKGGATDKLTHTGIYGIGCSLAAIEDLTGLDMNYYVKVNYTTVKKVVDAIGGIDVKSDYEFDTHGMKAKFHFKKGKNHLDGEHALAFARERKSFPDGDIQRNRNQAKVMQAIIKKATSSTTILLNSTNILNQTKDYMQINMTQKEIKDLIKMQLAKRPKWSFKRQSMEGGSTLMQCYSTGSYNVSVVQVSDESLNKCVNKIKKIMHPDDD